MFPNKSAILSIPVIVYPFHMWVNPFPNKPWPHAYKTFFMLNSAEHEISMLNKSNLIHVLESLLTFGDFRCFYLSNQSFKFDFSYYLKHKWDFKVWAHFCCFLFICFLCASANAVCIYTPSVASFQLTWARRAPNKLNCDKSVSVRQSVCSSIHIFVYTLACTVICPWIRKSTMFDVVHTLASAKLHQWVPNFDKLFTTIKSHMSSIMAVIGLEQQDLSAFELKRKMLYFTFFTNINQSAPYLVKI